MKRIYYSAAALLLLLSSRPASAQWYNDGPSTNAGGLVSDWSVQGINTATGSYSTAGSTGGPSNYGVFEHRGQSGSGASAALVNDGSFDASVNGRDYFLGPNDADGQQEISGTAAPIFGELFLQNGSGQVFNISNTNGIDVATSAAFENGITTTVRANTDAGAIRFYDNATYTNTSLGNTQHVNGYVSKVGNDAFTYPVGSGTDLRTLAISAPTNTAEISVAWFAGDPNTVTDPSDAATHARTSVGAGIQSVSDAGFWDWIPVTAATNPLTVTVSIPDMTSFASAANLRLVGWDGTQWVDLSGAATASGNALNSTLSGTVPAGTTITAIGIGSIALPLPVQLLGFTAQAQGCGTQLSWTTGSEQNILSYEVEYSTDGSAFRSLGTVTAAGSGKTYSFRHEQAAEGFNHYRLRIAEQGEKSTLSRTETVRIDCSAGSIAVFPNPASAQVWISGLKGKNTLRLLNSNGQVLSETVTGNSTEIVSVAHLPAAVYVLQVLSEGKVIHTARLEKL